MARPLTQLTGLSPFKWKESQEEAFQKLKTALTTGPVVTIPRADAPFRIETDASDYATGGVRAADRLWSRARPPG